MFNRKTVFVVGAGASADIGLPIGSGLCTELASMLDLQFERMSRKLTHGDQLIRETIEKHVLRPESPNRDIGHLLKAGREIAEAMRAATAPSIDSYLDSHSDESSVQLMGKIGIVAAILAAERKSKLFHDYRYESSRPAAAVANFWYSRFLQLLTEGARKNDLPHLFDNLSIICFNYDRCIEHYLAHGLAAHLRTTPQEAAVLLSGLSIIHPYGSAGNLQGTGTPSGPYIPFGGTDEPSEFLAAAHTIRTYTEQVEDESLMAAMHQAVETADAIIFLGFGFNRPNMKLLTSGRGCAPNRLYATTRGISANDWSNVIKQIALMLGKAPASIPNIIHASGCSALFDENRISLRPE